MSLSVWFVLTPNVLLLDYAGPAEALRMAAEMAAGDLQPAAMLLRRCAPVAQLRTSLGVELADSKRCRRGCRRTAW
jgi:transcriptional regulator GlxA family with amidase domain